MQIGLMRGGRFLAEESPSDLMQKHACDSLENVFLKLSIIQNKGKRRRSSVLMEVTAAATASMPVSLISESATASITQVFLLVFKLALKILFKNVNLKC